MKLFRSFLMVFVSTLLIAGSALADGEKTGQLVGIHVTGGYHLGLFIVLNGNLEFAGGAPTGAAVKNYMWVNNFASMATLDGKFSLMFPIASLPPVPKGAVVTIQALQDGFNVSATSTYDLSHLNTLIHADITPELIRQAIDASR